MEEEQVPTRHTSDESKRKLWLDYIGKLNDRHRRSIGSSGATSWVLLGVLVAVLSKIIPLLPIFLANRANLQSSLVSFVFEFDATFMLVAAYAYLLYFHLGGMAARAVSHRNRRLQPIIHIGVMILQICLVLSHFLAAWSANVGPNSLRWLLAGIGFFWAGNFCMLVKRDIHRFRQSRRHGIPIPWFEGTGVDARLGAPIGFGICALLAAFFLGGLVWHLSLQWRAGVDWVTPLGASCYTMVLVGALVALAHRGFKVTLADSYEALERSILLEGLSPSEIRARFIAQFIWIGSRRLAQRSDSVLEGD